MSSDTEIKNLLETEQEPFTLKGWDDNPYNFDDLCDEHQKVAKYILEYSKNTKDKDLFEASIAQQFKLNEEITIDKDKNPLVKKIQEEGCFVAIQGYVTETNSDGKTVKYPVVSFNADVRQYEKVYRSLLLEMKEFYKNNPDALK